MPVENVFTAVSPFNAWILAVGYTYAAMKHLGPAQTPSSRHRRWRMGGVAALFVLGGAIALLSWGGYLLVVSDVLPPHSQALVVLAGSVNGERARREEAMRLLREGHAEHVVLSVPQMRYLGEWVPDMMRRYIARVYAPGEAQRVLMCASGADSTQEEARALRKCLEEHDWRRVVVITSNYHTRRARYIWHEVFRDANPPFAIYVRGVPDGDFQPDGWWRKRRYAKTFAEEITKLVWTYLFE